MLQIPEYFLVADTGSFWFTWYFLGSYFFGVCFFVFSKMDNQEHWAKHLLMPVSAIANKKKAKKIYFLYGQPYNINDPRLQRYLRSAFKRNQRWGQKWQESPPAAQTHPWKCSRPDWIGLWATWSTGKCPYLWKRQALGPLPTETIPWFHDTHPLWLTPPCATWSIFINPAIRGEYHYKKVLGHRFFKPNAKLSSCTANSSGFETKSRNTSSCGWSTTCQPHAPRAPDQQECCHCFFSGRKSSFSE